MVKKNSNLQYKNIRDVMNFRKIVLRKIREIKKKMKDKE